MTMLPVLSLDKGKSFMREISNLSIVKKDHVPRDYGKLFGEKIEFPLK